MRIKHLLIYVNLLVVISVVSYAQPSDDFAPHYFDSANIADYVKKIDMLIESAEMHVFNSLEEMNSSIPNTKSENGIIMAYSICNTPEGIIHHFSTSRPPYLATPFGMNIVALFSDRAGLPFPPQVYISENQVFHAGWAFEKSEAEQAKIESANRRKENRKETDLDKIFGHAMKEAIRLLKSSNNSLN